VPAELPPPPVPPEPVQDLRFGVVGNGLRGGLARLAHRPEAGLAVAAVCDLRPDRLQLARSWYGDSVHLCDDYRELVDDAGIDAVFVLSPDDLHEEHACAALQSGKAVYLEKPMAITVDGADRVLATAAQSGSSLYVGHNLRHCAYVLEMKRLIERGDIGEVKAVWCRHFVGHGGDFYFRDWHAERRRSNTLLLQKGAHDIDVIHWLAGDYTVATQAFGGSFVYAAIAARREGAPRVPAWSERELSEHWPPGALPDPNPSIDVEDLSLVQMQLANGVLASYDQCHFTPDYWRNYTVIGDAGRLENFGNGEPGTCIRLWNRRSDYDPDGTVTITPPSGKGGHGGADRRCVEEFLALLRGVARVPISSPVAARQAVATACAASDSLRAGGGVRPVAPLAPDLARRFW
jgi:predicted dehydrogenase